MAINPFLNLTDKERKIFRKLSTPLKIQHFLYSIDYNLEEKGETCYSPRLVLRYKKANCVEGAIFAAAALCFHGHPPLLGQLISKEGLDDDHVIALYKKDNHWGALSKSKYPYLGFREPIHRNLRELTLTYFECYYTYIEGFKSIRGYAKPLNLTKFNSKAWITSEKNVSYIIRGLQKAPTTKILTPKMIRNLQPVTKLAKQAGEIWIRKKRIMTYLKKQQHL